MEVNQKLLMDYMKNLGYEVKIHEDTQQLYSTYEYQENEYPVFVRILGEGNLVQVITFVPCSIADSALNDISRFLHIVNKELDMPGFCCDEQTKTVFYRFVIPCVYKELSRELFEAYMNTSRNICQTFGIIIQALAMGVMTLEEVYEKMAEKAREKNS